MEFFLGFFKNFFIICSAAAWLTAQLLKIATGAFKNRTKKMSVTEVLFGTGGMPSSHTAAVCALASGAAIQFGLHSFEFALSAVLTLIVIRDATGVRREVGKHSELLNNMREQNGQDIEAEAELTSPDGKNKKAKDKDALFKEFIGHTPAQVLVGALLGIVIPILMSFIPAFHINILSL